MICIRIEAEGDGLRITLSGHAGYGPAGSDIVCAGMSTLAYTLIESAERLGSGAEVYDDGANMTIRLRGCAGADIALAAAFYIGAGLLAREYPDNVQFADKAQALKALKAYGQAQALKA